MIGKSLAHYSITAQIGKGGMGEVYQATDTKLGRSVAIKVLPEEFAKDADRAARFQREAKLLASLNHPNIAAIYGLEEADGTHFLVLELVEGQTLAERIQAGPIDVEEALKLGLQIAEALEAAHERGVIHRDLKPANIKVTPDGKVKVLDFGLAKAYAGEQDQVSLSNSPTLSDMATQQGLILGTAAYMSPEQARGKPLDKRTDVWAFGCVLYEMLTGQAAFQGEDVTEILAAVVKSSVNMDPLPANIHPRVYELITRCLQKDRKRRYSGIGDARYDIELVLAHPSGVPASAAPGLENRTGLRTIALWVAALIIVGLIVGVAVWKLKPSESRKVVRFDFELPEDQRFANFGPALLAVSPDGTKFVYSTSEGLYLRSMDKLESGFIKGTNENPNLPFFSPDGQSIGYFSSSEQQLKKIPVGGGVSRKICDATGSISRPWWDRNDTIIFGQSEGIMSVSANGGDPRVIVAGEGEQLHAPQILPGGKSVLFTAANGSQTQIAVQSLESRERRELMPGMYSRYLPTGHLVYSLDSNLYIVSFDLNTFKTGDPFPIVEGILWRGDTAAPQYAVSDSGTLVYIPGTIEETAKRILAKVDLKGRRNQLNAPPKAYVSPRVSPDGTKLVVQSIDADSDSTLWVYDLSENRDIRRLTSEGNNYRPIWTPDSQRITFTSDRDGTMSIYWMPADGSKMPEKLATAENGTKLWPGSWNRDGELAYMIQRDLYTDWDIWLISPGGKPKCLYDRPEAYYLDAQFSPDGQWMAYALGHANSDTDLYVEPFPPTGVPLPITEGGGGGNYAVWSPDGKKLYYRPSTYSNQRIELKSVDIIFPPELGLRNKQTLPIEGFSTVSYYRGYDIIPPDGTQFVMTFPADPAESSKSQNYGSINVILNWFEELKGKVPVQ